MAVVAEGRPLNVSAFLSEIECGVEVQYICAVAPIYYRCARRLGCGLGTGQWE